MKILSNKEYEKIINEKPQSYTYYMKDPYQAKKIDELENQNIKLEIELDKKDKEIERLNNIINEIYTFLSQYTITHTWQKVVIEDTIKYIDELKGEDKE